MRRSADTGPSDRPRLRILGPLRIWRDGTELDAGPPQQANLLGLLLAQAGRPIGVDDLIDLLWEDAAPASARNVVHKYVGAIRRLLEPGLPARAAGTHVRRQGAAYVLMATPDTLDLLRFRELTAAARLSVAERRPAAALDQLVAALELWHGRAGTGLPLGPAAVPVFAGIDDELYAACTIAAALAVPSGRSELLLRPLRLASAMSPLHEPVRAALIRALGATGRTAEAASVYQAVRAQLAEELGVEPGPVLVAAHHQVLRRNQSAPAAAQPGGPASPAQLPSPPAGFAGRRAELAALRGGGPGARLQLVTGMAGVGKTTLALRHAAEVAGGYPDGQLYLNLRGFDATIPPIAPADALRDLLVGLGIDSQGLPDSVDARSGLLRTVLAGKRVLMVLDNAYDYQQVEPLLPGSGLSRAVVTSRNRLPGLAAFHDARSVEVEPFDEDEVVEFLHGRLSSDRRHGDRDAMLRLGHACGNLPLALAIVSVRVRGNSLPPLDLLTDELTRGGTRLDVLSAGSPELDLRTVLSWSVGRLSPAAASTLAALSAHPGPDISSAAAISLAALEPRRASDILGELTMANLVREATPGRFVLHDLVREYATSLLPDPTGATDRLVRHYVRSTRAAILTFGRPALVPMPGPPLVGIVPEAFGSSAEATRWYATERRVLRQVCRIAAGRGDHRSAILITLDARPMSDAVDGLTDELLPQDFLLAAAEQLDDPVLRAEALRTAGTLLARGGRADEARLCLERAAGIFGQLGNQAGQANVLRNIGMTLTSEHDERIALVRRSVGLARDAGDPQVLATSLMALGLALHWAGRFDEAIATVNRCLELVDEVPGTQQVAVYARTVRARALAGGGHLEESAAEAIEVLELLRSEGEVPTELDLLLVHGDTLTALGRLGEAEQTWRRFLALATTPEIVADGLRHGTGDGVRTIADVRTKLARLAARR